MAYELIMPEMGEGVVEGLVSRWLKQEGDTIEQYEPVLEIETDKVTTEAMAEEEGTLLKIMVEEGQTVEVGTLLALIGDPAEAIPSNGTAKVAEPEPIIRERVISKPAPLPSSSAPTKPYSGRISPVVGRIAAEHEVDLNLVTGTGRNGRITKKDILAFVEQKAVVSEVVVSEVLLSKPAPPPPTSPAPQPASPLLSTIPLTGMRRAIADHMVMSKKTSPHVTTVFEFDFTAVNTHRRANKAAFAQDGAHLTFTAYIVAAIVQALKQHPMVNSRWTEDGIELLRDINVGMATALDEGLIVPVIKNADSLNLLGVARIVNDLAQRARSKQLKPDEVKGGTITITNHGTSGSLFATPIINQPQCGIVGVGKIEKRVKVINDAIAIRTMAYVSFTFDHRILDGATADYFVSSIKEIIENWQ